MITMFSYESNPLIFEKISADCPDRLKKRAELQNYQTNAQTDKLEKYRKVNNGIKYN